MSEIYYRPLYSNNKKYKYTVVTMQDFDEYDYNQSRFLTKQKFDNEVDAWEFLFDEANVSVEETNFYQKNKLKYSELEKINSIIFHNKDIEMVSLPKKCQHDFEVVDMLVGNNSKKLIYECEKCKRTIEIKQSIDNEKIIYVNTYSKWQKGEYYD